MRRILKSVASLAVAATLVACQGTDVLDLKANAPIPADAIKYMKSQGMTPSSPIMMRIFKEEAVLEIWKQKDTGRYALVKSYSICKYSGEKGPKYKEGDRQAPEGFYYVNRHQLNPNSNYHLSFNLGFPNAYDRSHGRTGTNLMVHGDCSSAGCYAMTDEGISEIYAFAREALMGGKQDAFLVQAFPFKMTAENMAKHASSPHFEYWTMLKQGYDHFELSKIPPQVNSCSKRYVFNMTPINGGKLSAGTACPAIGMPENLATAFNRQQRQETIAFEKALAKLEGRKFVEPASIAPAVPAEQIIRTPAPEPAPAPTPAPEPARAEADAATTAAPQPAGENATVTKEAAAAALAAPAPQTATPATAPAQTAAPVAVQCPENHILQADKCYPVIATAQSAPPAAVVTNAPAQ